MEVKQVKDLMEAYASLYVNVEEVQEVISEEVIEEKKIATGTGKKVMPSAKERSALAKKTRAGEDIGKPGKGFEKVAAKAAKQYGSEEAGKRVAAAAMFKAQAKEEVEVDTFDYILEYLVSEGYADTNKAALAIMANMSEDWKQTILERENDEPGESDDRPDVKAHNKSVKYRPRPRRPRIEDDPRYGTPMDRSGRFKH